MNLVNPYDPDKYPNCYDGHQYALNVVTGLIDVCEYVKGACKRYLRDIAFTEEIDCRFYFDPKKAERYLRSVQKFEHAIGKWATKNIKYEPWQKFIFMNIMGFINFSTKMRRFRTAHIEVPRGNAKSAMASQATLYFVGLDEDAAGNNIECVATKKDQAKIVVKSAQIMARKNKSFLDHTGTEVRTHNIINTRTDSEVRALSSDKDGLDGLNGVLIVCDELHAMEDEVFEIVDSGQSKRRDSLLLCITTAGYNVEGVGFSQSAYAKKVCLGEIEDDTFFAIIYTLDKEDDVMDPKNWAKANPNWGVSVDAENLSAKAKKAKDQVSQLANFKIKHLNIWVAEANAYFDLEKWDKCARPELKLEDFRGEKFYVAVDLASKIDLTGFVGITKKDGKYFMFHKAFVPEARLNKDARGIYDNAVDSGHLIATPGEAINYPKLHESFKEMISVMNVQSCFYDPWNATEFAQKQVSEESIEMVEFPMRVSNLSEPMKQLDALIRSGDFYHDGSPLLRWCFGNVIAKPDANDNVMPRKSAVKLKIDLAVATIMALAGWIQQEKEESIYEKRGMIIL